MEDDLIEDADIGPEPTGFQRQMRHFDLVVRFALITLVKIVTC